MLKYAAVNDASLGYFRTQNGDHEVDFIIQRDQALVAIEVKLSPTVDNKDVKHLILVAIEVKLSPTVDNKDVKHLIWLRKVLGDRLRDAMVITTGKHAYRRKEDGIAVIPASLLGP